MFPHSFFTRGTAVPRGANSPSDFQKGCPKGGVVNMDYNSLFVEKLQTGNPCFKNCG